PAAPLTDPSVAFVLSEAGVPIQIEIHLLPQRQRIEERATLKKIAEGQPQPIELILLEQISACPEDPDFTLVRLELLHDVLDEHALSGAGPSHNHAVRRGSNLEI